MVIEDVIAVAIAILLLYGLWRLATYLYWMFIWRGK